MVGTGTRSCQQARYRGIVLIAGYILRSRRATLCPPISKAAHVQDMLEHSPSIEERSAQRSARHISRQLQHCQDDLAEAQAQLHDRDAELSATKAERDRAMSALDEAHLCVSEYHRKLGAMERTVGHALVARGEIKDLQEQLAESQRQSSKLTSELAAAQRRGSELQAAERAKATQIADLERKLHDQRELVTELNGTAERALRQARSLQHAHTELASAQERTAEAEAGTERTEARRQEALAALSDVVAAQRDAEARNEALVGEKAALQQQLQAERVRAELRCAIALVKHWWYWSQAALH